MDWVGVGGGNWAAVSGQSLRWSIKAIHYSFWDFGFFFYCARNLKTNMNGGVSVEKCSFVTLQGRLIFRKGNQWWLRKLGTYTTLHFHWQQLGRLKWESTSYRFEKSDEIFQSVILSVWPTFDPRSPFQHRSTLGPSQWPLYLQGSRSHPLMDGPSPLEM